MSSPLELVSVRRQRLLALSTNNLKKCHSLVGLWHTPPIPSRDASVASIHVGLSGRIFLRWVGQSARDTKRCLQRFGSLWTAAVMIKRQPAATRSACWSLLNNILGFGNVRDRASEEA